MRQKHFYRIFASFFIMMILQSVYAGPSSVIKPIQTVSEMESIAKLSSSKQETSEIQGRLQDFFVKQIRLYQTNFKDTALGKSTLVSWGDIDTTYKTFLAPPMGSGEYYIYWDTSGPKTENYFWLQYISLPNNAVSKYGTPGAISDTHWHEYNHAMMFDKTIKANYKSWEPYTKIPRDGSPDHPYIEGLAERSWEWLETLLHKYKFEQKIKAAAKLQEQYGIHGEKVTYFTEHGIWGAAHEAWRAAYPQMQKIAPMPQNLRDDYFQMTGIKIPPVEAFIRFYMEGGVHSDSGKPIKVPEWVMWTDVITCPVMAGHLNQKESVSNNIVTVSFDFRITEKRKYGSAKIGATVSLDQGEIVFSLENKDPNTVLQVNVDGKQPGSSGNTVKMNLSGFKPDAVFHISLIRDSIDLLKGKKEYRIRGKYIPAPRIVNGVKKAPLYYTAEAIYFVEVSGTGQNSSVSTSPNTPQPATSGTASGKGHWKRVDSSKNDTTAYGTTNLPYKWGSDNTLMYSSPAFDIGSKKKVPLTAEYTWDVPPEVINAGEVVVINYSVTDKSGSLSAESRNYYDSMMADHSLWTAKGGWNYSKSKDKDYMNMMYIYNPDPWTIHTATKASSFPGQGTSSGSFSYKAGDGSRGEVRMTMGITFTFFGVANSVGYTYDFVPGDSKKPNANLSAITAFHAKEPQEAPIPPQIDNIFPKDGEVIELKTEEYILPEAGARINWFVHSKDKYRFPLPRQWEKVGSDDDVDTLAANNGTSAVFCGKGYEQVSNKDSYHVIQQKVTDFMYDIPGSTQKVYRMGDIIVGCVSDYDSNADQMFWHFYLAKNNVIVYIGSANAPGSGKTEFPHRDVAKMLAQIQFMSNEHH